MNPRLKELMLEAGYAAPEVAGRAQKLAELIIKECELVSLKHSHRDDDMGAIIARQIVKHFGVE